MKKLLCVLSLGLLVAAGSAIPALACGDKFLIMSRGTRYQRAPVARDPAAILIYNSPSSEVSQALAGVSADTVLRQAGYRPTLVASSAALDEALSKGGWDLVVAGLSDADTVTRRSKGVSVLPVAVNPSAAVLKESKRQFPVILKGPLKSQAFLDAVDQALASQTKTPRKANRAAF
jgi:hypothetical protein